MPIEVATLCPLRIAQTLLEPPRWQEITRRSLRAEQLRRSLGDVAMAGAVKSPSLDAERLGPLEGHRVVLQPRGNRLVKAGLERGHQRNLRQLLVAAVAWPRCRADCEPGDLGHFLHRRQHVVVDPHDTAGASAVHCLEADRRNLSADSRQPCSGSVSCARQCSTATAWSGAATVISRRWLADLDKRLALLGADPFDAAARQAGARSSMSNSRYLKLVEPRLATKIFMAVLTR